MPSAEDIYGSPYLNAKDVPQGDTVGIITECGPENFTKQGMKQRPKLTIRVAGFRKPIVINATNAKRLIKAFTDDYDKWPGNKVAVSVHEVEFQGNTVESILLTPVAQ